MKINIVRLRRMIVEAISDHMRLPRGPNSRDDADDAALDQGMNVGKITEASDTFVVRSELLDLHDRLRAAAERLEKFVYDAPQQDDDSLYDAMSEVWSIADGLKQAAGLSPSRPPPLKK